jgi:hypothetical protein
MHRSVSILVGAATLAGAYTNTDVKQFMLKNIDPIVLPGQYKSHMHSFFGSDAVNINTNSSAELQAGCSTAVNPNDFSVYWVPTLYHVDGSTRTAIAPKRFTAYYNFEKTQAEVAIPQDFKVLAGNTGATSAADVISGSDITWLCMGKDFDEGGKDNAQWPQATCSDSDNILQAVVWFPDCVDTSTLESAYSSGGKCSGSMKMMPQLRFSIRYDVSSIGSWSGDPPLELACGTSYCMHGDFINGWLPEAAENMVTALTEERHLQAVNGPNGEYRDGTICKTTATDADPDNGTNDYETSLEMMMGSASGNGTGTTTTSAAKTSTTATKASGTATTKVSASTTGKATSKTSSSAKSTATAASAKAVSNKAVSNARSCEKKRSLARRFSA